MAMGSQFTIRQGPEKTRGWLVFHYFMADQEGRADSVSLEQRHQAFSDTLGNRTKFERQTHTPISCGIRLGINRDKQKFIHCVILSSLYQEDGSALQAACHIFQV